MKNQKGLIQVLVVVAVVAVLTFVGYMLYVQKMQKARVTVAPVPSAYQMSYQQAGQTVAPVTSTTDLKTASSTLDATDTTQIDAQLNQLNSASSGF